VSTGLPHPPGLDDGLGYPFFQSVFDRKSRRMGLGMSMPGTLGYDSPYEAVPLTELEEALLLVAGTGLTGLNLGDIDPSMGADAMVQWTARTWPSSCSNHGTELFFTNDEGLYFLDMWNLMPEDGEISTLQNKGRDAQIDYILELVRGAKKQLQPGRAQMPEGLPGLFVFNHWNANKPGTTLFLPVQVAGALFSTGDAHGVQGDGEVCVTGLEAPMYASLRFELLKGRTIPAPQYRTAGRPSPVGPLYGTTGVGGDLYKAAQDAVKAMVEHVSGSYGMSPEDAYLLASLCVDLRISEIVDAGQYVVSALLPEMLFLGAI